MINPKIIIPSPYICLFQENKGIKVYVFYGGRKGGKTESIARCLLILAYTQSNFKIFCARETKDEFCKTLALVFKDIIKTDPQYSFMQKITTIYKPKIEFNNGSAIYFMGLSEQTKDQVKGIKANMFWFDEAHDLSQDTYDLLIPSIRENGSRVIISFNPNYEYDFVAKEFLINPAPNVLVTKINVKDNPYCSDEDLAMMKVDRERMDYERYLWKWEGGFKPESNTALFDTRILKEEFCLNTSYAPSDYKRVVIGIDPASTSKDFSNLSGLIVAGLNHKGEAVLLCDESGLLKPNELAKKASELYHRYEADSVVVETNQGGDYIKNTILGFDSSLRVIEVRAKQDKIKRMLPIANEVFLGRIKGIDKKVSEGVIEQFRKFTNNGYAGPSGESPDRAEAFAWACFELLGINEYGTQGLVFKQEMLACEVIGILARVNVGFLWIEGNQFGLIVGDLYKNSSKTIFNIKEGIRGELPDFYSKIEGIAIKELFCNDVVFGRSIKIKGLVKKAHFEIKNPVDFALSSASAIYGRINAINANGSLYNGVVKNWVEYELLRFRSEDKESLTPLVCAFCGILKLI